MLRRKKLRHHLMRKFPGPIKLGSLLQSSGQAIGKTELKVADKYKETKQIVARVFGVPIEIFKEARTNAKTQTEDPKDRQMDMFDKS